jgi:hypothetical protein
MPHRAKGLSELQVGWSPSHSISASRESFPQTAHTTSAATTLHPERTQKQARFPPLIGLATQKHCWSGSQGLLERPSLKTQTIALISQYGLREPSGDEAISLSTTPTNTLFGDESFQNELAGFRKKTGTDPVKHFTSKDLPRKHFATSAGKQASTIRISRY